jgi:dihydropyrimidinase
MSQPAFDCVIRGGRVATAVDQFDADLGIKDGTIAAIGRSLPGGTAEIDARNRLVLPGGIDPHAHIAQVSGAGMLNADTFESATVSAAFGGTTTVIPFAIQHKGMDLAAAVADYMALARAGAVIDYTFHMIVADPSERTLKQQIPALVAQGHSTIKVFMTYDLIRIDDEQLLDIMTAARRTQALMCVHAENHGMIAWMTRRLIEKGYTEPKFHAASHPRACEADAINRVAAFSEFLDQPVMIFHISTAEGVDAVRQARGRGAKLFAETCPQYLFLTANDLDRPGMDGVKWICSPPMRTEADQEAIWQGLERGDIALVSSDHAPFAFDGTGKLMAGAAPAFNQIPNGLPGIEARLPLLFDAMVSKGRLGLCKFVEVTATAPAEIYNLHPRKGAIAVGADADLVIWDAQRRVTLADGMLHDRAGYTPYAGRTVTGWPETVMRRGEVIVQGGQLRAKPGSGTWLPRAGGEAAKPRGRIGAELDAARNFGATLL